MNDGLPKGWKWHKLHDVTEAIPNARPEWYPDKEFGYVDISSIDNSTFRITEIKRLRGKDAPSRAKRPIKPNDTLFSNVRTYLRNIAFVDDPSSAEICSTGFTVLRPSAKVHPKYLFRYVLTDDFIDRVTPQQTGTHYPATSDRVVRDEVMPVPPLDEQNRIVAKLEAILSKVNGSKKRLERIPALLKRFRQSVLAAACSGRLTEDWRERNHVQLEDTWKDTVLSDICISITDGDHLPPPKQIEGVPFLTIGNISSGKLDFTQTRFVSKEYFERIKTDRIPKKGDILYTVVGATIGIPVIVDVDRRFCFQRHIAILRPSNRTTSTFLYFLMASPMVFRLAWAGTTGSAQPTLPLGPLRNIPVSIPPLDEQMEIVKRVEALFKLADEIQQRYEKGKAFVDKLTQSILAKAFRGELVAQDPNDEPVETVLQKMKGARK